MERDSNGDLQPDDRPLTWREFKREMWHRDRLAEHKEEDVKKEVNRKAVETAAIAEKLAADAKALVEKRSASNRWLIAIIALASLAFQIWFRR